IFGMRCMNTGRSEIIQPLTEGPSKSSPQHVSSVRLPSASQTKNSKVRSCLVTVVKQCLHGFRSVLVRMRNDARLWRSRRSSDAPKRQKNNREGGYGAGRQQAQCSKLAISLKGR